MTTIDEVRDALIARYRQRTPLSQRLFKQAVEYLPGGDTRSATFFEPYPTFIEAGRGSRVRDVDSNLYLDVLNNFTSLIHGHAHPIVTQAIAMQVARGTAHGAPTELLTRLARLLVQRVPSLERIRFVNSGTEAVMQSIRAARAFTGRAKLLKMEGGYHGSYDAADVSVAPGQLLAAPPAPVPEGPGLSPGLTGEVLVTSFNDLESAARAIREHRDELAAVIVEPVMGAAGMIPADLSFLQGLRSVTSECGVLLIFDEVLTFRLESGGAQQLYGVTPDLTALGKIIGGGLPAGAFGGKADIMAVFEPQRAGGIRQSGTYNGHPAAMAAGVATLELLTPENLHQLNELGQKFRTGLRSVFVDAGVPVCVTGAGSLAHVHFTEEDVTDYRSAARANTSANRLLHLALLNRGVFCASRGMFILSTATTEGDVGEALSHIRGALDELKPALAAFTAPAS